MFSSHIYAGLVVVVSLIMLAKSSPLISHQAQQQPSSKSDKRVYMSALVDDVNRCILACGECSNDLDLPDDKDPEQTLSLVCANTCMETTDVISIFKHLISKNLMTRNFAKCFLHSTMVIKD